MSSFSLTTMITEYPWLPQLILMLSISLVFYLFMVRPQQKRQQEQQYFLEKMKKGTQVVTIGGIYGKVHEVADDMVTLTIDQKGAKITVLKAAISFDSTKQYAAK